MASTLNDCSLESNQGTNLKNQTKALISFGVSGV